MYSQAKEGEPATGTGRSHLGPEECGALEQMKAFQDEGIFVGPSAAEALGQAGMQKVGG